MSNSWFVLSQLGSRFRASTAWPFRNRRRASTSGGSAGGLATSTVPSVGAAGFCEAGTDPIDTSSGGPCWSGATSGPVGKSCGGCGPVGRGGNGSVTGGDGGKGAYDDPEGWSVAFFSIWYLTARTSAPSSGNTVSWTTPVGRPAVCQGVSSEHAGREPAQRPAPSISIQVRRVILTSGLSLLVPAPGTAEARRP